MLNIVKNTHTSQRILHNSQVLSKVGHPKDLSTIVWEETDGIVIQTPIAGHALQVIETIRKHEDLSISMSPIFLDATCSMPKEIESHIDGSINTGNPSPNLIQAGTINERRKRLPFQKKYSSDETPLAKLLSFLFTRNQVLLPFTSRTSIIGYYFPLLQLFFKQDEVLYLFKTLELGVKEGLLQQKSLDHVHLCKSCHGSFINYREICPQCSSVDIQANDMIHHFVCAHVAPEKDFQTENGLCCPKCDKTLRHIGIDYDKPSSVFHCNTCAHEFQNPDMRGFCFDCNTENQLTELLHKHIGSYSITQKGEDWLLSSNTSMSKPSKGQEVIGLSPNVFRLLVEQEFQRVKNNKTQSVVGSISFSDAQLNLLNDAMKKSLQKEIATVICSYFSPSDVLCARAYDSYQFLLQDSLEEFPERLELIRYNLSKLLTDNLREQKLEVRIESRSLNAFEHSNEVFKYL